MYCKRCGKVIADNSIYCRYCGTCLIEEGIKDSEKVNVGYNSAKEIPTCEVDSRSEPSNDSTILAQAQHLNTDKTPIDKEDVSKWMKILGLVSGGILYVFLGLAIIAILAVFIMLLFAFLPQAPKGLITTIIILIIGFVIGRIIRKNRGQ